VASGRPMPQPVCGGGAATRLTVSPNPVRRMGHQCAWSGACVDQARTPHGLYSCDRLPITSCLCLSSADRPLGGQLHGRSRPGRWLRLCGSPRHSAPRTSPEGLSWRFGLHGDGPASQGPSGRHPGAERAVRSRHPPGGPGWTRLDPVGPGLCTTSPHVASDPRPAFGDGPASGEGRTVPQECGSVALPLSSDRTGTC